MSRQGNKTGKTSDLRKVAQSGQMKNVKGQQPGGNPPPRQTVTTPVPSRKKALLAVKPVPELVYDPAADFASTLAALVSCDSGAAISFTPALSTVRDARKYQITVTAGETATFGAPDPKTLAFEIKPADPKFSVNEVLPDYTWGDSVDLLALIAPQAVGSDVTPDLFSFEPALDSFATGLPRQCGVKVALKARDNYAPVGAKVVTWNILKKVQTLVVPVIPDHEFNADKERQKAFFRDLPTLFAPRQDGMGALSFDPPLASQKYATGSFTIKVWLAESDLYRKSDEQLLTFKIVMNLGDRALAFNKWWSENKADKSRIQNLCGGSEKKAKALFCGDPSAGLAPQANYLNEAELIKALDSAATGAPMRDKIWAALGHPELKGQADWKMPTQKLTSKGMKMHVTVSYGSIRPLQTLKEWKEKTDAEIFELLFLGPGLTDRVHATLENFPVQGQNFHVYPGKTDYLSGENKKREPTDVNGQVQEMITELEAFRKDMVKAIGAARESLSTGK